ncbi:MAG TPA: DMT family transporter [Terriglobales bacterium]
MNASAAAPSTRTASRYAGYLFIAAAALCWGISASLGRAAFTGRLLPGSGITRIDPLILSQARTGFSFIALLIVLLAWRGGKQFRLPRRDLATLFLLGTAGVAASNYFYYLAIQRTNVATAIIIQYTAPVWVLLYMVARRFEKLTLVKTLSVAMAVTGIALVIGIIGRGRLQLDALGVTAAVMAAFSFSYYNVGGHAILTRYDRWTVLLFTTMSASIFWIVVNPPNRIVSAHYSFAAWIFLAGFSFLSVLLPFVFYFAGLQRLNPTNAIIVSCLEPVFTILIAAFALHEVVHSLQWLGIAMVLSAILVIQRPAAGEPSQAVVEPVD